MRLVLEQNRPACDLTATPADAKRPTSSGAAKAADAHGWTSPELSVVVATLDERDNVAALVGAIECALAGTNWEVIFVESGAARG